MSATSMTEDYVKAIYSATEFGGEALSVSAIAQRMGVVVSTASENVKRLVDEGLLEHQPYRGIELTESGRALAVRMVRRHRILETYLHDRLGYRWDEVHSDAEVLEHAASDRLIAAMDADLGHPTVDPHGDPIPGPDGEVKDTQIMPATELETGKDAVVRRVSDADSQILRYLRSLGIGVGTTIRVVSMNEAAGIAGLCVEGRSFDVGLPALKALWVSSQV